jgi:hypothetical protein
MFPFTSDNENIYPWAHTGVNVFPARVIVCKLVPVMNKAEILLT